MVFGDIKDSFTSVAKKVTSTVDDVVVSPLENVKTTVTRTVIGPSLELMEHLRVTFKKSYLLSSFHDALLALGKSARKEKLSQEIRKNVLGAFKSAEAYMSDIEKYEELEKFIKRITGEYKKHLKDGILCKEFKDGAFVKDKSAKLAKNNKQVLVTAFEEFEVALKETFSTLAGELHALFLTDKKSDYRHEKNVDKTKNRLKGLYTTGLDKEFALISEWKELSRFVHGLQAHTKKIESLREKEAHSFGPSKTSYQEAIKKEEKKIISVLKNSIASQLKTIKKLEDEIKGNEKDIQESIEIYVAAVAEYKSHLKSRIATNESSVTKLIASMKKERTAGEKQKKEQAKKLTKSFDDFVKLARASSEDVSGIRSTIDGFHREDALFHEVQYILETTYLHQGMGLQASVTAYSELLEFIKKSLFSDLDIHREHQLHLQLANRVKSRHLTLVKSVRTMLLDLKQSNPKLYEELVGTLEKKNDMYTKRRDDAKETIEKKKEKVSMIKDSLWNTIQFESALSKIQEYISSSLESQLMGIYAEFLKTHTKSNEERYRNILAIVAAADSELKKSKVEVADKEKTTATIKKTASLRKELKELHEKEHNQEVFASALHTFADEMKQHITELKDMVKAYSAESKKLQKRVSSLAKDIQAQSKKNESLPLQKEMIVPRVVNHDALKIK